MRKFVAAFVGMTAMSTAVLADGMPSRAARAPAEPAKYNWTGFYLGVHGGLGWGKLNYDYTTSPDSFQVVNRLSRGRLDDDNTGWGGQIGFNWKTGGVVLGVEADYTSLDLGATRVHNFTNATGPLGLDTNSMSADYLATVRARFGFAWDRALFYVTGGWAGTDANYANTVDQAGFGGCPAVGGGFNRCWSGSAGFKSGWAIGGGIEYALLQNWTVKVEYLHADFGRTGFRTAAADCATCFITHNADLTLNVAKIGLNFKF